jgi:hypothetical protein
MYASVPLRSILYNMHYALRYAMLCALSIPQPHQENDSQIAIALTCPRLIYHYFGESLNGVKWFNFYYILCPFHLFPNFAQYTYRANGNVGK